MIEGIFPLPKWNQQSENSDWTPVRKHWHYSECWQSLVSQWAAEFLPVINQLVGRRVNKCGCFVGPGPQQVLYPGSYSHPSSWESVPDVTNSLSPLLSIQILLAFICREVTLSWQRSWAIFFRCCYCIAAELANVSLISFWHPARGNMQWAISTNIVSVGNSCCSEPATWSKQGPVWFSALVLRNRFGI